MKFLFKYFFKIPEPAPPSKTSRLPCPEDAIVNVSDLPVATIVSVPALPIILKPAPPLAKFRSVVNPPAPIVKLTVPSFFVTLVAV